VAFFDYVVALVGCFGGFDGFCEAIEGFLITVNMLDVATVWE